MNQKILVALSLLAVTAPLGAQDRPKQEPEAAAIQGMPDPKTPAHEALKSLVGTWQCTIKMAAMPGVPGMEEPTELTSIERTELLCGGLWLKSTIDGTFMGQPFQGVWLAGYDPFAKRYTSVWVDNHDPSPAEMTGTYDAAKKSWSWSGETASGRSRSQMVWTDADTSVETCWMTPPGGAESQSMEITRKRRGGVAAVAVAASVPRGGSELPAELRELHRGVGEWDAVIKMSMDPSQPATEERCHESVLPICSGQYTWSDFRGTMMGAPFEGHEIVGYDAARKEYVSYWVDSMSATWGKTTGTCDPTTKAMTMSGECLDPMGNPMTMREVLSWTGDDERVLKMEFESGQGTQQMSITYRRAARSKR